MSRKSRTEKSARKVLTWRDAIERYEEHLFARGASPRTVDSYGRELRYFAEHAGEGGPADTTLGYGGGGPDGRMSVIGPACRRAVSVSGPECT